jgi:hypothetical protein
MISDGEQIRRQLGHSYFFLPVPAGRVWHCEHHRAQLRPDELEVIEDEVPYPREFLACERMKSDLWPEGVRGNATLRTNLPQPTLPDGRWVVCIPDVPHFGSILPHEWKPLLAGAKRARGPLIRHAYEVTLGRLQKWKRVGREFMRRQAAREEWRQRGMVLDDSNDPMKRFDADWKLASWISRYAGDLHATDCPEFVPSERAREVLSSATGFAPSGIVSILRRESEKAPGAHVQQS